MVEGRERGGFLVFDGGVVWGVSGESQSGLKSTLWVFGGLAASFCAQNWGLREVPLLSLQRRGY